MDRKYTPCPPSWLKHLFVVLIVGVLYLLLQPLFSPLLDKAYTYLAKADMLGFLSDRLGLVGFGGLVVLSVLYLLYWEVRHWRIYVPNPYYLWLVLIGGLYFYYHCLNTSYPFWPIMGKGCLAWLDLFVLPCFVALLPGCVRRKVASWAERKYKHWVEVLAPRFKVRCLRLLVILVRRPARRFLKWQKPKKEVSGTTRGSNIVADRAIDSEEDDWLGFSGMVGILFKDLEALDLSEESLALGVIAEWGKGKSSFINLLMRKASDKGAICVNFNPRASKSVAHIQEDFFDAFDRELSKHYFGFGFILGRYTKHLGLLGQYEWTRPLESILTLLLPQKNMEAINRAIKAMGRRVYVVIDDLDRLTGEEILEVLKLIDRNASFSNTVFVTAYDKAYVNNVLRGHLDHGLSHCFIDKYVTWEVTLPEPDKEVLKRKMRGYLERRIEDGIFMKRSQVFVNWGMIADVIVEQLNSPRHLKRYLNLMISSYCCMVDEVLPEDYFLFSLLRYTDLDTYNALSGKSILRKADVEALIQEIKQGKGKISSIRILQKLFLEDDLEHSGASAGALKWILAISKTNVKGGYVNLSYYCVYSNQRFTSYQMDRILQEKDPRRALAMLSFWTERREDRLRTWVDYLSEGGVRNVDDLQRLMIICAYMSTRSGEEKDMYGESLRKLFAPSQEESTRGVPDLSPVRLLLLLKGDIPLLIPEYPLVARGLISEIIRIRTRKNSFEEAVLEPTLRSCMERIYAKVGDLEFNYEAEIDFISFLHWASPELLYKGILPIISPAITMYPDGFAKAVFSASFDRSSNPRGWLKLSCRRLIEVVLRDLKIEIEDWINSLLDEKLKYILLSLLSHKSLFGGYELSIKPLLGEECRTEDIDYIYRAVRAQKGEDKEPNKVDNE